MALSSRNLLKVYGDQARRDLVGGVVTAIFGECMLPPWPSLENAEPAGSLLTAVRFDWPGESPVGWVEELSRRMPNERFELFSDPAPAGRGPDCPMIVTGGRLLDGGGSGDPGWPDRDMPLFASTSPVKEPAFVAQGPLDLVAITIATLDRYYGYIYDDIVCPLHWKEHYEVSWLRSQVCSLDSLLTPDEDSRVAPHRALHKERSSTWVACGRAADFLKRACLELSSPHVASLLDDADRLAIERMRLLSVNLAGYVGSTQAVDVPEEVAATL